MNQYGSLNTLIQMKNELSSSEEKVELSRIHNPSKEVESALASFLTTRLNRIEDDANFVDIVRAAIQGRIEEASFEQLVELLHVTSADNNRAAEGITKAFISDTTGKTPLDYVRSNDTEAVAAQLYAGTNDQKVLQAVTYLGSILTQLSNQSQVEIVEN